MISMPVLNDENKLLFTIQVEANDDKAKGVSNFKT